MSDDRKISVGSYTIIITDVPDDVSDEQLRQQLYQKAKEEIFMKKQKMKEMEGWCS